jgi:hypothetical protein
MSESYVPGYRFPLVRVGPKPSRGQRVLDKEERDAAAKKHELEVKKAVKLRDGRCRWPEAHKCRGLLEAAHILDASLGGAMESGNLVTLCAWIHRRGPESIHGKQLDIDIEDIKAGANGPLSFWKQSETGEYYMVKRETAPFQYEKD